MSDMININIATADEMDAVDCLKGHRIEIGLYRKERGSFADVRRLNEVPGPSGKVDKGAPLTVTADIARNN